VSSNINARTARAMARHQVATMAVDLGLDLVLLPERTMDTDVGWVFFYESREYTETGDPQHALIGNAPLLVDRRTGALHLLGTERPVEAYLDDYRRSGDPYGATATELGG
jgi:hypothetical protein